VAMSNADRAARYIAKLKVRAAAPTVCPHCGGSLAGAAEPGSAQPAEPPKRPSQPSPARRDLTDADIATLPLGLHRVAKRLLIRIGERAKTFQFHATIKGERPFYKQVGHWPKMNVAQARAKAIALSAKVARNA
jgi:hypothetical protein